MKKTMEENEAVGCADHWRWSLGLGLEAGDWRLVLGLDAGDWRLVLGLDGDPIFRFLRFRYKLFLVRNKRCQMADQTLREQFTGLGDL